MKATMYIVGVGPGDPELLTLKGLKALQEADVLFVPKGQEDGNSTALQIIEATVPLEEKEIFEIYFPMKKIRMNQPPDPEVQDAWEKAAAHILAVLHSGRSVAFPTLGDPAIYSTGFYLCRTLGAMNASLKVKIIPGVSSLGACAAATTSPLCLGDEMLAVIPATFADREIKEVLKQFDTIVLMKVHRVLDRLIALLSELDLLENAVLVERSAQTGERVINDITTINAQSLHYFSTMIVRKN